MMKTVKPKRAQPQRPSIHLVYLVFLFLPWLFFPPTRIDVLVAIAATLVYLPVHFGGFITEGPRKIWFIAVTAVLGIAVGPFHTGFSVFHIYAAAMAGFLRPFKLSGLVFAGCAIVFVASGLLLNHHILELAIGLIISIVVWISTLSDAEERELYQQAERERTLEAQQASLVERERIARDLHDLLGHTLTLVALKADLAGRLIDTDIVRAKQEIESIQTSSREALSDVRITLRGLTSTNIKRELENGRSALEAAGVALHVQGEYPSLSADRDTAFGLLIREAVTNIVRHSSATEATIRFNTEDDVFKVTVSDNGEAGSVIEGSGLSGLRARLEALGGMFSVSETGGIHLHASLPA